MPKIPAPKHPNCHPDRDIICKAAMKVEYQTLADRAQAAGWSRADVATALMVQLADHHFLAMEAGDELFAREPH